MPLGRRLAGLPALVLALCLVALSGCAVSTRHATAPAAVSTSAFNVALIGDMPYSAAEEARFDAVLDAIDRDASVQFTLHVGDIKGGGERCDDALLQARWRQLQRLRALVYTPGDNEWTDCHRASNGRYLPTERLAFVRRHFFPDPSRTGGRRPFAVTPQSSRPGQAPFVENVRFEQAGVVFATLHLVGSANGLAPWSGLAPPEVAERPRADRLAEVAAREAAALAWIDEAFDVATARGAAGVLLAMQANPGIERAAGDPARRGFEAVLAKIRTRAAAFGRPVLIVHGDHHEYLVDRPWADDAVAPLPHVMRVQCHGSPHLHWVRISIDPQSPQVFGIEPRRVPGTLGSRH